jgi:hypothetical protein
VWTESLQAAVSAAKPVFGLGVVALVFFFLRSNPAKEKARSRFIKITAPKAIIDLGVEYRDRFPFQAISDEAKKLARDQNYDSTEQVFKTALLARLEAREASGAFKAFLSGLQLEREQIDEAKRERDDALAHNDVGVDTAYANGEAHPIDLTPDLALSRGTGDTIWYACRSDDVEATLRTLGALAIKRANWESGTAIAALTDSPWVFIPPLINGWVVVSKAFAIKDLFLTWHPHLREQWCAQFEQTSQRMGDVQYFAVDSESRSVQCVAASGGTIKRLFTLTAWPSANSRPSMSAQPMISTAFSIMNNGAAVQTTTMHNLQIMEIGAVTDVELGLGYERWRMRAAEPDASRVDSPDDPYALNSLRLPYLIAGGWSVDPTSLDQLGLPPSLGYLVRF